MKTIIIELTISEIAAISQQALAEKIVGEPWGAFCGLWERIDKKLNEENKTRIHTEVTD